MIDSLIPFDVERPVADLKRTPGPVLFRHVVKPIGFRRRFDYHIRERWLHSREPRELRSGDNL